MEPCPALVTTHLVVVRVAAPIHLHRGQIAPHCSSSLLPYRKEWKVEKCENRNWECVFLIEKRERGGKGTPFNVLSFKKPKVISWP